MPISHISTVTDPAQTSAVPGNSVQSGNDRPDFAGALREVTAKPARKSARHTSAEAASSGGPLPTVGNLVPPPAVAAAPLPGSACGVAGQPSVFPGTAATLAASPTTPAAATKSVAAGASGASGLMLGAAAGNQAGVPGGPSPAATYAPGLALAPANASDSLTAASLPDLQATSAAMAAAPTSVPSTAAVHGTVVGATADGLIGAAGATAAAVSSAGVGAAGSSAAGGVAGRVSAQHAGAPGTISTAATRGGDDNTPSSAATADADGAATTAPADPAAQMAAMAAVASSATASEISTADADSTLTAADASALPAKGGSAGGAGGPVGPGVPELAANASAQAATAAPPVMTRDDAGTTDKRSHGTTADSSTSGGLGDGAAGLAQVSSVAVTAGDATPTAPLQVAAGVDTPEFGQGLADRVSWMVGNNLNGAKLQVNPAQLGPIEVRIAVQGGHAQVWMTTHSAVTRDALESSTGKLREMLGAQGFGQVSVDISQRSFQERSSQAQTYDWTPPSDRIGRSAAAGSTAGAPANQGARASSAAFDAYA